jgi:hypothetical protein
MPFSRCGESQNAAGRTQNTAPNKPNVASQNSNVDVGVSVSVGVQTDRSSLRDNLCVHTTPLRGRLEFAMSEQRLRTPN